MTPAEKLAAEKRGDYVKKPHKPGGRRRPFECLLRLKRKEVGLTQKDVASKCGIHLCTLSEIERGAAPALSVALKLAAFFGEPVEALWTAREEPNE